jgi:hypothetical protein
VHDFIDPKLKRAVPYGVYDINNNVGWVSVGTDHDTASFAVNTIRRWWRVMGKKRYHKAKRLMITADAGGSNGYRIRLWKVELQKLANELKMPITVCHMPPGTSKWNKIEHRLFSFISINWRGEPLARNTCHILLDGRNAQGSIFQQTAVMDRHGSTPPLLRTALLSGVFAVFRTTGESSAALLGAISKTACLVRKV